MYWFTLVGPLGHRPTLGGVEGATEAADSAEVGIQLLSHSLDLLLLLYYRCKT